MTGIKGRSGGARKGSGPVRRRFTLSGSAAIYVKAATQSRLNRRDVTIDELCETLEAIVRDHAKSNSIESQTVYDS